MRRSLIVLAAVAFIGLGGCDDRKQAAQCPADKSAAELTAVKSELSSLKATLSSAQQELTWKQGSIDSYRGLIDKSFKEAEQVAKLAFNPAATAKAIAAPLIGQFAEAGTSLVHSVSGVLSSVFGSLGNTVFTAGIQAAMDYPDLARNMYEVAKPELVPAAKAALAKYGEVLSAITSKRYDPYIGSLAANEGHSCLWEMGAEANQKTEKCAKVLSQIGKYYGISVDQNLVRLLGIAHRRYVADGSERKDGFLRIKTLAEDLIKEAGKS